MDTHFAEGSCRTWAGRGVPGPAAGVNEPAADRQFPSLHRQPGGNADATGGRGVGPNGPNRPRPVDFGRHRGASDRDLPFGAVSRTAPRLGAPGCSLKHPNRWVMLERGKKIRNFERLCAFRIFEPCSVGRPRGPYGTPSRMNRIPNAWGSWGLSGFVGRDLSPSDAWTPRWRSLSGPEREDSPDSEGFRASARWRFPPWATSRTRAASQPSEEA